MSGQLSCVSTDAGLVVADVFTLTEVGVIVNGAFGSDHLETLADFIERWDGARMWWLGDLILLLPGLMPDKDDQFRFLGKRFTQSTCQSAQWVADKFAFFRRRKNLKWAHHAEVAGMDLATQDEFLDKAESESLSSADLRALVKALKQKRALALAGPLPEGKRRCIVIDPPWPVEKIEREERPKQGRDLDYQGGVMTLEQISTSVGEMVKKAAHEEGCHLYLWVTQKYLPAGLQFFSEWGVKYQCVMTWVKPTGMTPYSWMYNAEHVLFGCVGSLPLSKLGLKLTFDAPVSRHSAKPDVFYDRVREASPEPRLSIYERRLIPGFAVWGDEVKEVADVI
jgi:N6-adenosine-specific RNA methylase IME4